MEELRSALKHLKGGKARDPFRVTAESLQYASEAFLGLLLDVFNDVISLGKAPPDQWKTTRLIVIFKKGDAQKLQTYCADLYHVQALQLHGLYQSAGQDHSAA